MSIPQHRVSCSRMLFLRGLVSQYHKYQSRSLRYSQCFSSHLNRAYRTDLFHPVNYRSHGISMAQDDNTSTQDTNSNDAPALSPTMLPLSIPMIRALKPVISLVQYQYFSNFDGIFCLQTVTLRPRRSLPPLPSRFTQLTPPTPLGLPSLPVVPVLLFLPRLRNTVMLCKSTLLKPPARTQ